MDLIPSCPTGDVSASGGCGSHPCQRHKRAGQGQRRGAAVHHDRELVKRFGKVQGQLLARDLERVQDSLRVVTSLAVVTRSERFRAGFDPRAGQTITG
jgi:hypothetical protein